MIFLEKWQHFHSAILHQFHEPIQLGTNKLNFDCNSVLPMSRLISRKASHNIYKQSEIGFCDFSCFFYTSSDAVCPRVHLKLCFCWLNIYELCEWVNKYHRMESEKSSKVYAGKIEKSGNLIRLSRSASFFKMLFKVHSNGKFISLFAVFFAPH